MNVLNERLLDGNGHIVMLLKEKDKYLLLKIYIRKRYRPLQFD